MTLAAILSVLGNLILSYFSQQISQDIGMTDAQYGMLTGYAYFLVQGVAMVLQGYAIDFYSLNRVYVVGFGGVLGAGALLMQGFAKDFNVMLIGMLFSALGSSVFAVLPIPILSDILPPEQISFGGAIFGSNPYLAEFLAGNLAELCLKKGISWRWAVVGLGTACGASSLAIFAFLREPPIGRFIVKRAGDRLSYGSLGLGRLIPLACYGAICQRYYTKLPTISLYTTAIGACIAAACVAISILSRVIAGDVSNRGYAIGLTAMTLTFVIGEGWQGPLSVMITLALPPEIRSFAISLFFAVAQLIGPAGSVLFGIYLTIGDWVKGTPSYVTPARIYMLVALMGGYIGSAIIYILAVPAVNRDMEKRAEAVRAGGYPEVCAFCILCTRVVAPPHII
ncbi:MFS general substrate transporter [Coccomyxa subellipsoidea C-169]|uniref:MFS general substrate transporter n=1 Tax=Coccomyxa subellipsoidea (strain C-169) TaxID=574566 RepID=I0Z8U6_COCSC|nr:MFS general substrate transporter [Coccomyxa subellipsoidea C-169]EIE27065.1 MFS general substrate transporter [Coccomyxa subellipsoidea C-169]|eukprot:XP_005651609.1 MFS general substrate transporter [Coccomyxa subellipsoidea C-169]